MILCLAKNPSSQFYKDFDFYVGIPSSPVKGSDTGKMKLRVGAGGGMASTQLSHNVANFRFALPTPTSVLGLPIGQHISRRCISPIILYCFSFLYLRQFNILL
uniref:Flavoprotein pyridine nucleotide cytochrome reductase-like FAD-binding domain-containing protein n=1 Tax=Lactuca sativa TaxID=4236 RepID=A0A9R1XUA7_LACSA|nr:hypothetical protein LSAT_V11C300108400 [Lactuca sativa]